MQAPLSYLSCLQAWKVQAGIEDKLFSWASDAKACMRSLHLIRVAGQDSNLMRPVLQMREGRVQGQPDLELPWHPIQVLTWQVGCLASDSLSVWLGIAHAYLWSLTTHRSQA